MTTINELIKKEKKLMLTPNERIKWFHENFIDLTLTQDLFLYYFGIENYSAYSLFARLKRTKSKISYKNVHQTIKRLKKLGMIQSIGRYGARKAIQYELTDKGLERTKMIMAYYNWWSVERKG